jgi:hypothetical protein
MPRVAVTVALGAILALLLWPRRRPLGVLVGLEEGTVGGARAPATTLAADLVAALTIHSQPGATIVVGPGGQSLTPTQQSITDTIKQAFSSGRAAPGSTVTIGPEGNKVTYNDRTKVWTYS